MLAVPPLVLVAGRVSSGPKGLLIRSENEVPYLDASTSSRTKFNQRFLLAKHVRFGPDLTRGEEVFRFEQSMPALILLNLTHELNVQISSIIEKNLEINSTTFTNCILRAGLVL